MGQTEPVGVESAVRVEVVSEVGRTGATAEREALEVLVVEAGQNMDPQARSVGQQPPPSVAGQDWKPGEQVEEVMVMTAVAVVGGGAEDEVGVGDKFGVDDEDAEDDVDEIEDVDVGVGDVELKLVVEVNVNVEPGTTTTVVDVRVEMGKVD